MAGGSIIGALRVVLGLDTAQFETGAKQASSRADQLSSRLKSSFGTATAASDTLRNALAGLGSALAVQQIVAATQRALDYTDAIADLADRTGASTKLIQEFRFAAQMSGSSVETADEALGKFTKTLGLAQSGSDAQVKLFRDLGVTSTDFDTAFRQTLEGLSKLPTVQERNATALQLFGKSAGTLTGLLGQGAAGFDLLASKASELGIVLRDDVIRNAGVANDQLDTLKMIMDAQFASAVAGNADRIAELAQIAADAFTAITRSASDSADEMTALFGTLDSTFDPLLESAKGAFAGIREQANWTRDTIANILDGVDQLRNFMPDLQRKAQGFDERYLGRRTGFTGDLGPRSNLSGEFTKRAGAQDQKRENAQRETDLTSRWGSVFKPTGPRAGSLPTVGTSEGASAANKAEAERKKAAAEAKRIAEKAARDEKRFQDQLDRERAEQLRSTADLATTQDAKVNAEQAILDQDKTSRLAEIALDKDMTDEQKKQLSGMVEETATLKSRLLHRRDQEELARQELDHQERINANQTDLLDASAALARTSKERRAIELQLLDLQFQQLDMAQQAIIDSSVSTPQEKQDAKDRQAVLAQMKALASQRTMRDTAGPLGQYLDSLPKNADELNEAYQNVAVDGLKSLNDGLAAAITGSKSLGDVFGDMASSIIADLARIAVQQMIIKPLATRLFGATDGGSSGGASGLFGKISKIFSGGNDAPENGGITGTLGGYSSFASRFGIPGLATGGHFRVGAVPGIDRNVLSVNGIPRAMVSADERVHVTPANDRGRAQPAQVVVAVEEGALFRPVIRSESGAVSSAGMTTVAKKQSQRSRYTLS